MLMRNVMIGCVGVVMAAGAALADKAADVQSMLDGSFVSEGSGEEAGLYVHFAPVQIEGLGEVSYFEMSRTDDVPNPFQQGVMWCYERQGSVRVRVFNFSGDRGDSLVGMWAAPEVFPEMTADALEFSTEIELEQDGDGFSGRSPHPMPTLADGAVEVVSELTVSPSVVRMGDTGYAADGSVVWGSSEPIEFASTEADFVEVSRMADGIVAIDLVVGQGAKHEPNAEVAVDYTGWLASDGTLFDSSRVEGHEPFKVRLPGRLIEGWNVGMSGVTEGTRRRLVLPPEMAYGERANARIPANSTLIFDVEVKWVGQPPAPPEELVAQPRGQGEQQGQGEDAAE